MQQIRSSTVKACELDPLPATIMRNCYSALVPVFKTVTNPSLSTGSMPKGFKIASLRPLLKKPNTDFEQYPDFRLVTNLKFLSKLIEKFVFVQLNNYLKANGLDEPFNLRTNPTTVQRLHCLGSQMTSYWTGRGGGGDVSLFPAIVTRLVSGN